LIDVDWSGFKTAVQALVVALTGLPSEMVVWADEPRPNIDPGDNAIVVLDITSDEMIGSPVGELVSSGEDPIDTSSDAVMTYYTTHTVTVQVRAESIAQEGSRWAAKWVSQVLSRFGWDSTQQSLRTAGIAFVDTDRLVKLPDFQIDDRAWSAASANVRFAVVLSEVDTGYDGAFIKSAAFSGEVFTPLPGEDTL
jgi:hypothetical protein